MAAVELQPGTVGSEPPASSPRRVDEVLRRHHGLLAEYAEALRLASQPTRQDRTRRRRVSLPPWRSPPARQYGSRKLCEAHVKRRLALLASVYRQESLATNVEAERAGYDKAASECQVFADTLSFWRLPTWLAVLPLLGGALGQLGGVVDDIPGGDPAVLGFAGFYVVYLGILAVVVMLKAFTRKRTAFFPTWRSAERLRSHSANEDESHERNIYRSEEELFSTLRRGRPLEQPLDLLVLLLAASTFALAGLMAAVFIALANEDSPTAAPYVVGLIGVWVPYLLIAGWTHLRLRKRRWR